MCGCTGKLLFYVACLGEVIGYTEEAFGRLQNVKVVQKRGSGTGRGRQGTGNGANGLGVRGKEQEGYPG